MFNALNRFISRLDGDVQPRRDQLGGHGFQVLRNTNAELAIEPWFDFIVGINGRPIDDADARLFAQEVRNCAGGAVALGLWSAKGQRTRTMRVPVPAESATLGLTLQSSPLNAVTNIWHVLDVAANSPADNAGLLPYSDYILGTPDGTLDGESALGELVDDYIGRPLKLWVYNNEYDVTREVEIQPSREWGGEGALGCVLGYGALHRLPPPLSEPVDAPGETMFDGDDALDVGTVTDQFTTLTAPEAASSFASAPAPAPPSHQPDLLVPAQMTSPPPIQTGAPPRTKKKERHGHTTRGLDDYFAEEEKKSKALDGGSSIARSTPPPPPPKAGGPPPSKANGPPSTSPKPEEPKDVGANDVD